MPLDRLETIRTELLDVSRAEALGRLGDLVRSHRQAGRRVYLVDSSKRVRKLLEGIRRHWKTRKPRKVERRVAPYLLVPSMTAVVLSKKAVREQVDLWIVEIEKVKGGSG